MGLKSGSKSGKGVKQGSSKLGIGKVQSSGKQGKSEEQDVDTSVMRPAIEISVSGVPQLVQAYQAATEELKTILSRECDIIYECRVCRNLFRSLANMMAHKRVYCKTMYSFSKHCLNRNHMVEDYTVVIQPEPAPSNSQDKQDWATSDQVPDIVSPAETSKSQIGKTSSKISSTASQKKGLREIVERLTRNSYNNNSARAENKYTSAAKLYDAVNESMIARKNDSLEHNYHLEDIETTNVGKFQTKLASSAVCIEKEDLMKAQISELQTMTSQMDAILGPDGQTVVLNKHSSSAVQSMTFDKCSESKSSKDEHVCPDCNIKFSTRKTLNHHVKSLHVTFRLCYPCPCCKSTFVNPWSVYRHLYKVHRKTAAQVRRMRPQIQKKAFRKEYHNDTPTVEANTKSDAVKELQRLDQENQAWMDNFEDDLELQRCGGCGRRFERRAALNSHSQICQKRIAARNNIKPIRNIPTASSTDKITKLLNSGDQISVSDRNKKPSDALRILDTVQDIANNFALTRARQSGVSNWVDHPKKEVKEKKIEIQIRKDYCKMSSSSSVVALSNDTQSEPSSRPPSRIVDEICFDNERDWDSSTEVEEDDRKEESDSEDSPSPNICRTEMPDNEDLSEKEDEATVQNSSYSESSESDMNIQSTSKCEGSKEFTSNKNKITERPYKRRFSNEEDPRRFEGIKKIRQSQNKGLSISETSNLCYKSSKVEQFHPIMEARMKKLINIRRLQCLPCQKKFIKLTNLRRHVAVHIGWCRYRCVLCPFKCFAKYDCVDHVCKVHLKGSQRNKAAAMVEYLEEQVTEPLSKYSSTCEVEELKDDIDQMSQSDDMSENLSIEVHTLNIEDIKNIVGVINYSTEVKSSNDVLPANDKPSPPYFHDVCNKTEIVEDDSVAHNPDPSSVIQSSVNEDVIEKDPVQHPSESSECTDKPLELMEEKPCSQILDLNNPTNLPDEAISSPKEVAENKIENVVSPETKIPENLCDDNGKETIDTEEMDSLCSEQNSDIQETTKYSEDLDTLKEEELRETSCEEETNDRVTEEEGRKSTCEEDSNDEDPEPNADDKSVKTDFHSLSQYLMSDENKIEIESEIVTEEQISEEESEIVTETQTDKIQLEEVSEEQTDSEQKDSEDNMQTHLIENSNNDNKYFSEFTEIQNNEQDYSEQSSDAIPTKMQTSKESSESKDGDNEEILNIKEENLYSENSDSEDTECAESSECVPSIDDRQHDLRKMVMEVIFGSGVNSDIDLANVEANKNLYSLSVNGDNYDSVSIDGRISRTSCSSDSNPPYDNTNHISASVSTIPKTKLDGDNSNAFEGERRERPVRNRVKVTKEDFIYDFTDSFAKKEDSKVVKKKQMDMGRESVKSETSTLHNNQKTIPKMMLVRTDSYDAVANSHLPGPVKGTWSSVFSPNPDYVSSKSCVASSSQMYSARKVPRTHDMKP